MLMLCLTLLAMPTVFGHVQRVEKIMNGVDARITNYPYQAGLLYFNSFICGGTIISKNVVLTAAHCVEDEYHPSLYEISVGSTFIEKGKKYALSKIITHPYYNPDTIEYDIAIIKLKKSLKFSNHVKPIEIQPMYSEIPDGTIAYVSGWGLLNPDATIASKRLQAAEVRIISNEKCQEILDEVDIKIEYTHLCAIDDYRGTCSGDSGGPLIANKKLIGVVSFGIHECDPPFPGVYVNVSSVRTFINLYI